jgi:REP element-mobilizing transposase RayT
MHVTLRVRAGIPSLRSRRFVAAFRETLSAACERGEFRVCQFSVQRDHVHLVIEAAGKPALGRGMKAVASRLAHAVQRVFGWRGPVLFGRYHLRVLRTPREVRNALAYVLLNGRKHGQQRHGAPPPVRLDAASSADAFDGWRGGVLRTRGRENATAARPAAVARARTWLLAVGWRRHGLIDPAEVPGRRPAVQRRR